MSDYDRNEGRDAEHELNPTEKGRWASALIALLGVWLLAAAIVFDLIPANFWNEILVGVTLIAIGGYNYTRRTNERLGSVPAAVLAALLGAWLLLSPFIVDAGGEGVETMTEIGYWNNIIVGLLAVVLGVYSAYEGRETGVGAAMRNP